MLSVSKWLSRPHWSSQEASRAGLACLCHSFGPQYKLRVLLQPLNVIIALSAANRL